MTVLLDTHVLLWWFAGAARLSNTASRLIDGAERVLVSPISCWEVAMLERRGRIRLDRPLANWIAALLSPEAAGWAGTVDDERFPGDPADWLIYATARDLRVPLVSKDVRLHAFAAREGVVRVVW